MATVRPQTDPPGYRPATVQLRLLGGFAVVADGQALPERAWGGSRKARALVKLLALAPGHRLHRDQLLDALWPDLDPDAAGPSLHQALYLTRRALAPLGVSVVIQSQMITFEAPGDLTTDLAAFRSAAAHARHTRDHTDYAAALEHYGGDLLPDDRYEEWAIQPREIARAEYLGLLRDLARSLERQGDEDGAIAALLRLVAAEPPDEAGHVALMRLYARRGERAQALQQFSQLRAALKREIDAEPEPATQQLYAAILAGQPFDADATSSPAQPASTPPHNLVLPLTTLFGREAAIAEVRELLATARLVTLTGAGGCGKTRLALAVGAALTGVPAPFPDGVWWADLAPLTDPDLLAGTVARAAGVRERPNQPPIEMLTAALRDRTALLVLDNCEHLVVPCANLVAALLAGCPRLRILATSREALRVVGEHTWHVPSLDLPEPPDERPAAAMLTALAANPTVRLFVDRARLAQPRFALTAANAAAVATICRRLDGIPLAIELAAARVPVLTPPQLAARLDDALRLLTGGPRTALPRHQTLRATLDWSYQLLAAGEGALLERLAVFAGGCTLAAAEEVCGLGFETLDLLAALVDKSLVQVEPGTGDDDEPRYRLLETVRQFAAERLAAGDDAAACRNRHAAYFLRLAESAEPLLLGEHQAHWLARLTRDLDNLRAALAWYAKHDRAEEELRLASALLRFWLQGVLFREGLGWLDDGLARDTTAIALPIRARSLYAAAALAIQRGVDWEGTRAEESLTLYRILGDRDGQAAACNVLGTAARLRGDYQRARAYLEEALALWSADGQAQGMMLASANLGALLFDQGDHDAAITVYEAILPVVRTRNDAALDGIFLGNLSLGYACTGRFAAGAAPLNEAIQKQAEVRDWPNLQLALITLALVAAERGDAAHTGNFLGASAKLRTVADITPYPIQQRFADRAADTARVAIGEAAFAAAYEQGHAWSSNEMVARAIAYLAD